MFAGDIFHKKHRAVVLVPAPEHRIDYQKRHGEIATLYLPLLPLIVILGLGCNYILNLGNQEL